MAENEKQDPGKKPMDDWFVGSDDVVQKPDPKPTQKPAASVPPPLPDGKPPGTGPLVAALVALALLGSGGYYFYHLRSRPVRVEEVTIEMPKQPEAAPVVPAPIQPVVPPAPAPEPTVVRPSKSPAKRPAVKKSEEPVQPPRPAEEPAPHKVEAPPKPALPPVASSGIMLWSGEVEKNGTILIDGGESETGTVNGAVLPGVPVTVRVEPKDFTVAEAPSAATGWKRIAIHSQKKAHIVVTVYWNVKPN